ncbi:DUF4825 domain-containing protein [Aestuariimicrobium sp. Y1814]|uniref:DUF4825 domain-containing protein n=1 Tax=Aestuariimicrobium sp. Y1814 TaxID=3418742 RepID=UPI003DA6F70B
MITRRDLALRLAPLLLMGVVTTTGCTILTGTDEPPAPTDPNTPTSEAIDAPALFEAKTDHLGDNSRVIQVVDATRVSLLGTRTIALLTDQAPLTLAIALTNPALDDADLLAQRLRERAVLMLACISNADAVSWTIEGPSPNQGSLTRTEADKLLGVPVRTYATSADRLRKLAVLVQQ